MNTSKIIGYLLLIIGVAIIFWGIYSSYNIFTVKAPVPEIFKIAEEKAVSPKGAQGLEAQIQKMLGEQLKGLLPVNTLPALLNLMAWSIFMGILFFGGGQMASIGVKLIKS